ncbi:MAG TPA: sugar ABC transporter ATP-binding protein [Pyrinomonadaceae bacterium]|nr:sugar ABC transporter ATP-binding protein [Pyrinomonadaceae bacterium]
MTVLSLSNISKRFGPTVALDGVSLTLEQGEVHALIGENGAGKSTLMNVLAGLVPADQGTIEVEGARYAPTGPVVARAKGIALIHQELSLFPHLTVAENIMMGMEPSRWGVLQRQTLRDRTADVLDTFHHPEIKAETPVGNLSIAARQIVEICRAIAARARIILMDEPTSSLQRDDVEHLFSLIRRFGAQGITVVYISHFLEEVREIANNFTVLRDGRSVATGPIDSATDDQLIAHMVGRPVENLFPSHSRLPAADEEPVLDVQGLSAPPALKSATLQLRRGEILGIAGLMGSGRTQLVRTMFGLNRAGSGSIKWRGTATEKIGGRALTRLFQRLGYLSEDRKGEGLAVTLSIADNVTMTRLTSCSRWGWLNLSRQRRQAEVLTKSLSVRARDVGQPVASLSGGNQQKIALARLLHQEADVLLLDEPTRGIDIGSKAVVYQTIAECAARGKAVLMVSSYLPELFGMCDRLAVMSRGQLSAVRPICDWTPESVMQAAIGGKV